MLIGGDLLRKLRTDRNKSLEQIAADAGIDYRALSNIELGKTQKPAGKTLNNIIAALDRYAPVSIQDRRPVYIAYGYHPPCPPPTAGEGDAARACWRALYDAGPIPAYLYDARQCILAWNASMLRLCQRLAARPARYLLRAMTFDLTFGPLACNGGIVDVAAYRRAFVAALQCELDEYATEPWCAQTLAAAQQRYPAFAALWAEAQARLLQDGGESAEPLTLRLGRPPPSVEAPSAEPPPSAEAPSAEALTFRRERSRLYPGDPRFHTALWRPADAATWRVWVVGEWLG